MDTPFQSAVKVVCRMFRGISAQRPSVQVLGRILGGHGRVDDGLAATQRAVGEVAGRSRVLR